MKVTVYSITDCVFCKQEKEYLTSHNVAFEEKNLETNKEFLTEMLAVSNNFAGTPVTKIEKDDGKISILKGFTKEEFDQALGLTTPAPSVAATATIAEPVMKPTEPSSMPEIQMAAATMKMPQEPPSPLPTNPSPEPLPPVPQPPQPPPITPSVEPVVPPSPIQPPAPSAPPAVSTPPADDKLNSVLENLQAKVDGEVKSVTPPTAAGGTMPNIPEPDFK